jgi:L-malate glycosyltransferase
MTTVEPQPIGSEIEGRGRETHDPTIGERPPLRVLHVVSSLQVGGMEQFVLRIAAEQQRGGHYVSVMGLQGGPLLDEARRLGLEALVLEGPKMGRALRAIQAMLRRQPDIAHAHNPGALPYALLAKLSTRSRVVMTRHGQEPKRIGGLLEWRGTDAVVAVSEAAAAAMRAQYPANARKISVIINGVHRADAPSCREKVRAELGLTREVVGIVVARLDRLKGHESLLRALSLLREASTKVTMLVAGDGPERANLETLAGQLELGSDRLRLLGYRSDISELLSAADFFVLPSLTEGLPLSILEAMAQALPVVATPVGGIPEVITDGLNGLLVPVNQPAALSAAIAKLAGDPILRRSLGETACSHAHDHFSFERMAQRYEELYRSLLARDRASGSASY